MKKLIITIGRYCPPTKAHIDMNIEAMREAERIGADFRLCVIYGKQVDDRSPFPPLTRAAILRKYFDESVIIHLDNNIFEMLKSFALMYDKIIIVCGEDRFTAYYDMVNKRLPDGNKFMVRCYKHPLGRETVSGTIARKFLKERDLRGFTDIMHNSIPFLSRLYIYESLIPFIEEAQNGTGKLTI